MSALDPVYILDAVRTPVGKIGGALSDVRPDDLAATVIGAVMVRTPSLDPASLDDVHLGNSNGAGEENRNVGRLAGLIAGLPTTVPGATTNRLCGSGLEAVANASRMIAVGEGSLAIAGGVESMTRAPWVLPKPERPFERGNAELLSTAIGWRMTNPRLPAEWTVSLGEGAELLADRHRIERDAQDEFAALSHRRAADAWAQGRFDDEVVAVEGCELVMDECIRPAATQAVLGELRPVFRPAASGGTVTAGNSSPMNDGAAALLLSNPAGQRAADRDPLAEIVSRAVSGCDPHLYGLGPVEASWLALERAGIGWGDLAAVELNEAFAVQALACLAELPQLDPSIVNVNGGAISIGHPIGASGARILTTLAHELRRRGGGYGLATMCIGVGQGIAMVIRTP